MYNFMNLLIMMKNFLEDKCLQRTRSLEPIGIEDWSFLNHFSFLEVKPIFFSNFLISFILWIHFGESEIIVALMFFPFHWDFSSSPHPNSVNFVVSFNSVDTVSGETVFSEMIDVSDVTVFKV